MGNKISFYERVSNIQSSEIVPFDIFLENIKSGHWQDYVLPLRAIGDKKERDAAKKKVPSVTLSGHFSERKDDCLVEHSGFIGMDIDDCDPEELKNQLRSDGYVVAAFTSISGTGLCIVFKINPRKHRESFYGISEYLYKRYEIICDPTSVNPSRARFVSFDPHIYIADQYKLFAEYPKEKPPKKIEKVLYSAKDFDNILEQIVANQLNITQDSYYVWYRLGFAIVHQFGEAGRQAFHLISQYSSKYDSNVCDKQYTSCLKHKGQRESTISTFYYYAKEAGCDIYSDRTRMIAYASTQGKKAGLKEEQVVENLDKFEDIKGEDVKEIVHQVFKTGVEIHEDSMVDEVQMWLRQNYDLKKNEITRFVENGGKPIYEYDMNTIWVAAKRIMPKLSTEMLEKMMNSSFVPMYNPLKEWFNERRAKATSLIDEQVQEKLILTLKNGPVLPHSAVVEVLRSCFPRITALFDCIKTKDPDYALYFGAKWLVGIISSIYGEHSPLMLVLAGDKQNTGKTEFFRRLIPADLKPYYSESKLDKDKDDDMLMCQRFIIMDDEMGGKSKKEIKRLKELTSKQVFTLREPYGRTNVDLVRLAVLCGTTNEIEILHDPTGNRRIIPIYVEAIDQEKYNTIDKEELFMEVWLLYQVGLRWRFSKSDIEYLGADTDKFEALTLEFELIQKYFEPGKENIDKGMTATDIKVFLEHKTNQKLILDRIGKELKRMKFVQSSIRLAGGGGVKRLYWVKELQPGQANSIPDEDLPF